MMPAAADALVPHPNLGAVQLGSHLLAGSAERADRSIRPVDSGDVVAETFGRGAFDAEHAFIVRKGRNPPIRFLTMAARRKDKLGPPVERRSRR